MSTPPNARAQRSKRARDRRPRSVTSQRDPEVRRRSWRPRRLRGSMSRPQTAAPRRRNASTQARPIPDAAPVTSATSPAKSAGSPRGRSFACSRSQYSTSKISARGQRLPARALGRAEDDARSCARRCSAAIAASAALCAGGARARAPGRGRPAAPGRAWPAAGAAAVPARSSLGRRARRPSTSRPSSGTRLVRITWSGVAGPAAATRRHVGPPGEGEPEAPRVVAEHERRAGAPDMAERSCAKVASSPEGARRPRPLASSRRPAPCEVAPPPARRARSSARTTRGRSRRRRRGRDP